LSGFCVAALRCTCTHASSEKMCVQSSVPVVLVDMYRRPAVSTLRQCSVVALVIAIASECESLSSYGLYQEHAYS